MSPLLGGTLKGGVLHSYLSLLLTVPTHSTDIRRFYVSVSQRNVPRKGQPAIQTRCEPFSSFQLPATRHAGRHPSLTVPCFHPLEGWRTPSGGISFRPQGAFTDLPKMAVPCGSCIGCRLERGRQWTVRLMHEASQHDRSCFITLTYSDEHLPRPATLVKSHFQDFMARFRNAHRGQRFSYFMCGEYGDLNGRPHYHAIIFGYDFGEKVYRRRWPVVPDSVRGRPPGAYSSTELEGLWPLGFNAVGAVTPESAGYVARYCLKKVTGVLAEDHYKRVDPDTGEIYWLVPEYANMSTRPAIGKAWFNRYGSDVSAYDGVYLHGKRQSVPRYYDKLREREDARKLAAVKLKRRIKALDHLADNTPERLAVREVVAIARSSTKKREL